MIHPGTTANFAPLDEASIRASHDLARHIESVGQRVVCAVEALKSLGSTHVTYRVYSHPSAAAIVSQTEFNPEEEPPEDGMVQQVVHITGLKDHPIVQLAFGTGKLTEKPFGALYPQALSSAILPQSLADLWESPTVQDHVRMLWLRDSFLEATYELYRHLEGTGRKPAMPAQAWTDHCGVLIRRVLAYEKAADQSLRCREILAPASTVLATLSQRQGQITVETPRTVLSNLAQAIDVARNEVARLYYGLVRHENISEQWRALTARWTEEYRGGASFPTAEITTKQRVTPTGIRIEGMTDHLAPVIDRYNAVLQDMTQRAPKMVVAERMTI